MQLRREGRLWRRNCISVLSHRAVREALGPVSSQLLKLARGAGVLAVTPDQKHVCLNQHQYHVSTNGVYLVPLTKEHNTDINVHVHLGTGRLDYPIGTMFTLHAPGIATRAQVYVCRSEPEISVVSFRLDLFDQDTAVARGATMVHELWHVWQYRNNVRERLSPEIDARDRVTLEAPAYAAEFTVGDIYFQGLLSQFTLHVVEGYDPATTDIRLEAVQEVVRGSPSLLLPLLFNIENRRHGYEPAAGSEPSRALVSYYAQKLGHPDEGQLFYYPPANPVIH